MTTSVKKPSLDCISILVIDDDPLVAVDINRALEGTHFQLHTALDGAMGAQATVDLKPDLIVLDNVLPDGPGIGVLKQLHELAPNTPVLFIADQGSGNTAIEAMKLCAYDYLPKPLDPTRLRTQIQRALSLRRLLREHPDANGSSLTKTKHLTAPSKPPTPDALVGECPAMHTVFKSVGKVASKNVVVLLSGEHGTGKEAIAREIHRHSQFSDGPFVKLPIPGRSEERLEEEFFGSPSQRGHFESSSGGTLLLQEIGELPLSIQAKLLHTLRDRTYTPNGSIEPQELNCRVIAIATTPLEDLVRKGVFRSDLFYVLNSLVIPLPPLRQRKGDLPLLISHSLQKLTPLAQEFGVEQPRVAPEVMKVLCEHLWPGNIDELESVLRRAIVDQKGHVLHASGLLGEVGANLVVEDEAATGAGKYSTDWATFARLRIEGGTDTLHADAIAETERKVFARVLKHTGGNQAHAARILGITRASLRKKLRLHGIAAKSAEL